MKTCGCKRNPAKIIPFPSATERAARKGKTAAKRAPAAPAGFGGSENFDSLVTAFRPAASVIGRRWAPDLVGALAVAVLQDTNAHDEARELRALLGDRLRSGARPPTKVVETISKDYLRYGIDEARAFAVALLIEANMPEAAAAYTLFAEPGQPGGALPAVCPTLPIDVQMDMGTGLIEALNKRFGDAVIAVAVEPGSELAASFQPWSVVIFPTLASTPRTIADLADLGVAVTSDGGYVPVGQLDVIRQALERPRTQTVKAVDIPMVGTTWQSGKWRVHRYAGSFLVTDLTNAGKRGRKVMAYSVSGWPENRNRYIGALVKVIEAAKAGASLEQMDAVLRAAAVDGPAERVTVNEREQRGVDVDPPGEEEVRAIGADGTAVGASPTGFMIRGTDVNEMRIIPRRGAKRDIRKVFDWVKANVSRIPSMTFGDISRALDAEGIKTHQYCGMD